MSGAVAVANRYGLPPAAGAKQYAAKLEHSEVRYVKGALTPLRIVDPVTRDASQCIAESDTPAATCACGGVKSGRGRTRV
jgi:hypothetical protein